MDAEEGFWRASSAAYEDLIAANVRKKMRPFRLFLRRLLTSCQYGAAVALLGARHRAGLLLTTDEANEVLGGCLLVRLEHFLVRSALSLVQDGISTKDGSVDHESREATWIDRLRPALEQWHAPVSSMEGRPPHRPQKRPRPEDGGSSSTISRDGNCDDETRVAVTAAKALAARYAEASTPAADADLPVPRETLWARQCAAVEFAWSRLSSLGLAANARTVLLRARALWTAGRRREAAQVVRQALDDGVWAEETIWSVAQMPFLRTLEKDGVLPEGVLRRMDERVPASDADCFLQAAEAAHHGDQTGSKHGAVIRAGDRILAVGHNHVYYAYPRLLRRALVAAGKPLPVSAATAPAPLRVRDLEGFSEEERKLLAQSVAKSRVMHAEIHCLAQIESLESVRGADCFIVELDSYGVGYEEAVPCPMCNKALQKLGVAKTFYSAHRGLVEETVNYHPELECESLEMARG